jgi:hypothetical protein
MWISDVLIREVSAIIVGSVSKELENIEVVKFSYIVANTDIAIIL